MAVIASFATRRAGVVSWCHSQLQQPAADCDRGRHCNANYLRGLTFIILVFRRFVILPSCRKQPNGEGRPDGWTTPKHPILENE